VLYTIGVVGFVPFSWWLAWLCPKHVAIRINTSSSASSWLFIHLRVTISVRPVTNYFSSCPIRQILLQVSENSYNTNQRDALFLKVILV
jgi:hypothetical protein